MFEQTIDFSKYTSLKIGVPKQVCILEKSDEKHFAELAKTYTCVGYAYNLLIAPQANNIAMLSKEFDYIHPTSTYIEIGARTPSGKIFSFFKQNNLGGVEFLQALPGSAGGLLKMNAGMKDFEMQNVVVSACINGEWSENLGLAYRTSAISGIISALRLVPRGTFSKHTLKLCQNMRRSHPKLPSCGSCFKNPKGDYAGRLLDLAGLKGFMRNGIGFSDQHANFLVHSGGASFEDALWVIKYAQQQVQKRFGILLEQEVQIIA